MNNIDLFPDSPYVYGGSHVPRVTHILSEMLHEEALMDWAFKMGKVGQDINTIKDHAADKGTIVHSMCEYFLRYRMIPSVPEDLPYMPKRECQNAFNSFMLWISNINANHMWRVLALEEPLVCDKFGGTMDALLEIDGRIYLIDFKTSNFLNYKYCLQVAAYRYMLRITRGIEVDGCCVLRLEKKKKNCFPEEMFFDLHDKEMKSFMDNCEAMFLNTAEAYWQRAQTESQYKCITGKRF